MKCPKCQADNPEAARFCLDCGTKFDASTPGQVLGGPPAPADRASFTKTLETTTDELTRGTLFAGRYEIIEELGAGGMGRVYRVFDSRIKEEVALKLLRPEVASRSRTVERFRNEIRLARKIVHKNVCRMFDMGEERGTQFITMEYVAGEDLKSFIRRAAPLNAGKAVLLARQVAEGLAEAHKIGVVHRDLKPGNIMIDKDGDAKIMDFGIARSLQGGGTTVEGAIIGTPEYMSPEQVEGKEADQRTDIYALGVILFEMVTGRVPFEGATPFSIANKHKTEPAPAATAVNPLVPQELSRLILRCMEKPPEKRYQTTEELLSDLETIEAALPTTEPTTSQMPSRTRPKTSREITVKFRPRRLVVPAAIVLSGAFLLWLFVFRPRPDGGQLASDRPSIAILRLANRSGDKTLDDWKENFSTMLYDRLSLSKYVYVAEPEQVTSVLGRLNLLETSSYTDKDLREIGRLTGVRYLGTGYFTRAGETFLVSLTVKEAGSGRGAKTDEVRGEGNASLIKMADELALKVKPHLEVTAIEAANDIDGSVEGFYTDSIDAYSYYLHGRRLFHEGKLENAVEMYKKAVAIDPDFAMAYRALGSAYHYIDLSEYKQYMDKALEVSQRSNRVPIREKLIIRAGSPTLGREENLKAVTELLRLDPEDGYGNLLAGNLYLDIEEFTKAAACYEICIRHKPQNIAPYDNFVVACVAQGEYERAQGAFEKALENVPDKGGVQKEINYLLELRGEYGKALAQSDKLERLFPKYWAECADTRASIHLFRNQFTEAEAEIRRLVEDKDSYIQSVGRSDLRTLYLIQGRYQKALAEGRWLEEFAKANKYPLAVSRIKFVFAYDALGDLDSAERELSEAWKETLNSEGWEESTRIQYQAIVHYWKSVLLLKRRAYAEARKSASQFAALYESEPNRKLMRFPLMLQGQIELADGSPTKAIELLSQAKALQFYFDWTQGYVSVRVPIMDLLGSAYFRAGEMEKARQEFEDISRLSPLIGLEYADMYAKSFYHLGQVYERLGQKSKAKENYRKFLDLWKAADPGLPEVMDAKARLAALLKV